MPLECTLDLILFNDKSNANLTLSQLYILIANLHVRISRQDIENANICLFSCYLLYLKSVHMLVVTSCSLPCKDFYMIGVHASITSAACELLCIYY